MPNKALVVSSQSMLIRVAELKDIPVLVELCQQHARYEGAEYAKDGKAQQLVQGLFLQPQAVFCAVAEYQGKIVGYVSYMRQFSTWDAAHYLYMDCLFLLPEARGMGLGAELMAFINSEAQRLGCKQIQWQTPKTNTRAIHFYQHLGATAKSKERFFWCAN